MKSKRHCEVRVTRLRPGTSWQSPHCVAWRNSGAIVLQKGVGTDKVTGNKDRVRCLDLFSLGRLAISLTILMDCFLNRLTGSDGSEFSMLTNKEPYCLSVSLSCPVFTTGLSQSGCVSQTVHQTTEVYPQGHELTARWSSNT